MEFSILTAAALAVMTQMVPPEHAAATAPAHNGRIETANERLTRYGDVAPDLTAAVAAELGPGASDWAMRTLIAQTLGAIIHESRLDLDVDVGPCSKSIHGRCPGGAVCLGQIEMASYERTREGWSKADIANDRMKCLRLAARRIRGSMCHCARVQRGWMQPQPLALLAEYASGSCLAGHKASAEILGIAASASSHLAAFIHINKQ